MSSLSDIIPIPPPNSINTGLSSASESTMLRLLGRPGEKTRECSRPSPELRARLVTASVGPFRVTGIDFAVASLTELFSEVREHRRDVFDEVKTAGVLCVRARRGNPNRYSNHSWGTAIDLYFGEEGVIDQGVRRCHRGVLALYPYFHRHGWYWGAEFSGDSVDSMHFEMAEETIEAMADNRRDGFIARVEASDLDIRVAGVVASRQADAADAVNAADA